MLIKRITLLVIIFVLNLSTPALAAEAGSGVIEGQLVNGTEGGSSVADQGITLKTYLDDAEVGSTAAKTDAEGQFVFDGLSTESAYSYQATLTFQGADYYSERLSFDEGETRKSTDIIVYDSTTSDEAIKVATAHTVIYVEQGSLRVEEYFFFVNEADRTYIGSKEVVAGTMETLRFSLPEEATELHYTYGFMECCIYGSEGGFVDTMAVLPGNKEVAYSYKVDYSSETYTFSQKVNYPITSYDLLVQGESVEVASDRLALAEPLDTEGSWFNHLSGGGLVPDDTLLVRLSGLPETNNQGVIVWTAVVLVVLVAGFGFGYLLRKKKVQTVSPEGSLAQKRQGLLVELAQLDNDFESGKVAEEVYHRLRAERKTYLVELTQRAKEERGSR